MKRVMCECPICACSLTVKICVCVVFSSAFMDRLFASVIQCLPRELHEALAEAELLGSCVLDAYPRSSAEELRARQRDTSSWLASVGPEKVQAHRVLVSRCLLLSILTSRLLP